MPTLAKREQKPSAPLAAKTPRQSAFASLPAHAAAPRQHQRPQIAYAFGQLPLYPGTYRSNPTPSKLTIGSASSPQERQAAETANRVSGPTSSPLSTTSIPTPGLAAPPIVAQALHSSGQPLDPETRAIMEPRFGHDFSDVRIHHDALAAASARAIDAHAYTLGSHIVFASSSHLHGPAGSRLLAHELTHVVQQRQQGSNPALVQRQPATPGYPKERIHVGGATYWTELSPDTVKIENTDTQTWVIFKQDAKGVAQVVSSGKLAAQAKAPAPQSAPPPSASDQFTEATGMKDPRLINKGLQGVAAIAVANTTNPIPFTEIDAKGNYKISANPLDFLRLFHGLGGFVGEEKELVSVEKEASNRTRAQQLIKTAARQPALAEKLLQKLSHLPKCAKLFTDYKAAATIVSRIKMGTLRYDLRQAETRSNNIYNDLLDCLGF